MTKSIKFQAIAKQLLASIGEQGDALLSERELAGQFKVNRLTVRRALAELEIQKYIYRRARLGAYWGVAPRDEFPKRIAYVASKGKIDFGGEYFNSFGHRCSQEKWELLFCTAGDHIPDADLVIIDSGVAPGVALKLRQNLPVIRFGGSTEIPPDTIDQLSLDCFDWGYRAARYLLAHHGRRIGFVCAKDAPAELKSGVEAALIESNIKFDLAMFRAEGVDSLTNGALQVASLKELGAFDAVIAYGIAIPLGVLLGLNENEPERYVPMIVPAFSEAFRLEQYPIKVLEFNSERVAARLFELVKFRLASSTASSRHEKLKASFN